MAAIGTVLLLTTLGLALGFFLFLAARRHPSIQLPPAPPGLLLLGNLFLLKAARNDPSLIKSLASKYGPIFTLYSGSIPTIIVTGRQLAQDALVEQGAVFASRPSTPRFARILSNNQRTVNAAVHGAYWRTIRRNLPLAAAKLQRFSAVRKTAVDRLVSDLASTATAAGITVRPFLRFTLFSIVSYMCFGCWLEDADVRRLDDLMREMMRLSTGSAASTFETLAAVMGLPFPSWASKVEAAAVDYGQRRREFLEPKIDQARRRYAAGELEPGFYLYSLFELQKQGGGAATSEVVVSDEDVLVLTAEFLNVAAETTAATLECALACLVKQTSVQQKLFDEVQAAVSGRDNDIEEATAQQVKYLQAVVKETLRLHLPGYFTLPHSVTQPAKLGGYDIPVNARILFHIYLMANDPDAWPSTGLRGSSLEQAGQ